MIKIGKINSSPIVEGKNFVLKNLAELGKLSTDEKIVAIIFAGTAIAWITRGLLWKDFFPMVDDSTVALIAALSFFIIPSFSSKAMRVKEEIKGIDSNKDYSDGKKKVKKRNLNSRLLNWKAAVTIP